MASSIATMHDPSIYTRYVNVHLSIEKLDRTNYDAWTLDIKLWLNSQLCVDHITQSVASITENG